MADRSSKVEKSVPGKWYIDTNCIACGLCAEIAPENAALDPGEDFAHVKKQPATPDEEKAMVQAADECPTQAIGNDG